MKETYYSYPWTRLETFWELAELPGKKCSWGEASLGFSC
jgi:hypothetical protein